MIGMSIMLFIHRALGRLPFRLVLWPVVTYYFLMRGEARRASREYLQRLHGVPPSLFLSLRHFIAFGETLLDKMLAMSGRANFDDARLEGLEHIEGALANGRGALLLTAHVGNLELCRTLARRHRGLRLTILVFTRHAEKFNRMIERLNPGAQIELMQVTEVNPGTVQLLSERIARGELVVISGDRIPLGENPRITQARFLDHEAPFPIGPFVLAALLQCPVVLLFCIRQRGSYRVIFQPFSDSIVLPRREREQVFQQLAQQFADRLAGICREAPLEWFNFFPFWAMPDQRAGGTRQS